MLNLSQLHMHDDAIAQSDQHAGTWILEISRGMYVVFVLGDIPRTSKYSIGRVAGMIVLVSNTRESA